LGRKLTAENIKPGRDGRYSTAQIVAALIGDKQHRAAQLRSQRAQAKTDELETERVREEIEAERKHEQEETERWLNTMKPNFGNL